MNDERKTWALIGLIFLVALIPSTIFILEWYIKNVLTPIGAIEKIAWALDSSNPWVWVFRLTLILIGIVIVKALWAWIKEKTGL